MNAVSQITAVPQLVAAQPASARYSKITLAIRELQNWIEVRDYAGYAPYDILNSPLFSAAGLRLRTADWALIQIGKRFGGNTLRALLRVPPGMNPKALGLMLARYCDQFRSGAACFYSDARSAKMSELQGAVAVAQLPKLEGVVRSRIAAADSLTQRLQGFP